MAGGKTQRLRLLWSPLGYLDLPPDAEWAAFSLESVCHGCPRPAKNDSVSDGQIRSFFEKSTDRRRRTFWGGHTAHSLLDSVQIRMGKCRVTESHCEGTNDVRTR